MHQHQSPAQPLRSEQRLECHMEPILSSGLDVCHFSLQEKILATTAASNALVERAKPQNHSHLARMTSSTFWVTSALISHKNTKMQIAVQPEIARFLRS